MATFGKVDEFDPSKEEWSQYVERLTHFFQANEIDEAEKKRAVFLSVIGPATYKLLRNLLAPAKPGEKAYSDLVTVLSAHYSPAPSEIVQRFKFHSRFRNPGESVATYVSEIRSLAEFCNFGSALEEMLRDRIVCGINDDTIQRRLLAEPRLTFKKALEIAQGIETANMNMRELRPSASNTTKEPSATNEINKMTAKHETKFSGKSQTPCYRCGKLGHKSVNCRFKETTCNYCGKVGHLKSVCYARKKKGQAQPVRTVWHDTEEYPLYTLQSPSSTPPISVSVVVDGSPVQMELDTGAALSLMAETVFRQLFPTKELEPTKIRLCAYSGEPIEVLGSVDVKATYKEQSATLPLLVVKHSGPTLLGRNWLQQFKLDWREIHTIQINPLEALLEKYNAVFKNTLGTLKDFKAHIHVDPSAKPKYCKARTIPYAVKTKVEEELNRLVSEGTLEPVQISEWASPIVPVIKPDKSVRICGDFKQTINPVSKLDKYPIPKVEDLFVKLTGGCTFTKIDLSQAYLQLALDEESKKFVVINTHKGLFRYTRLPFGISAAPGIFQRVMDNILQGIPGVVVYLDDILVTAPTAKEHLQSLETVMDRLMKAGLHIKREKCMFMSSSVTYLGHKIDAEGLHPLPDKVRAITEAPCPINPKQLKAYLGLLTYYAKFLPNLSSLLSPLYSLLQKDSTWKWEDEQQNAFDKSKELLTSSNLLIHFNPNLPITLSCDASNYGIGAVLAHCMADNSERPIAYASRSLTKSERNYSQLEKEGLACIFGVTKFHSYLFGHPFDLVTDHKPLLALLNEHKPTSPQASARVRRWSLSLSAYEYTLKFRCTNDHSNADALSRVPLREIPAQTETPAELVLLMEHLADSPVTAKQIQIWTRRDPTLSTVLHYLQYGWPAKVNSSLSCYFSRSTELSVHEGCILWGNRVVIPPQGWTAVLQELHEGHTGMSRMKSLARMYIWWPKLDVDIEEAVRHCSNCQLNQSAPPAAPLHPWSWPSQPWTRIHIDYMGPFMGKTFFILIDAHSKWIDAVCTNSPSAIAAIEHLRTVFSQFGIPETIVSDNAACFTGEEFKAFTISNGIKHITSAPHHPSSNGLAERAVQIVKNGLKKLKEGTLNSRLAKILFAYRITPQSTTGTSPSELMLNRRPRCRLDLVKPNMLKRVESKQLSQKINHDTTANVRSFCINDPVIVKNFSNTGKKWLQGHIIKAVGPLSYVIKLNDGRIFRRHVDHLRKCTSPSNNADFVNDSVQDFSDVAFPDTEQTLVDQQHRYPQRDRRPPDRYRP